MRNTPEIYSLFICAVEKIVFYIPNLLLLNNES